MLLEEMRRSPETSLLKTGEDKEEETRAGLAFGIPWAYACLGKATSSQQDGWVPEGTQVRIRQA